LFESYLPLAFKDVDENEVSIDVGQHDDDFGLWVKIIKGLFYGYYFFASGLLIIEQMMQIKVPPSSSQSRLLQKTARNMSSALL
jgi:hypothetical protein